MKKAIFYIFAVILFIVLYTPGSVIAKNKVRIGGNVVVDEGTEVKDAVALGGSVTVYGKVRD
jgi:UDP-3-O-[3-hydroxymyristoyl] glucosamine N-acyltransferase